MLDGGAFVAGLEYATGVEARVLGKPSPAYFAAALDALEAEPELTWMVTDDLDADVRGAQALRHAHGAPAHRASSGPRRSSARTSCPTSCSARSGSCRTGSSSRTDGRPRRRRPDRDRADRRARSSGPGFRDRCFTPAEQEYCESRAIPGGELRGALLRQGGGRKGARLRCPLHLEGDRDRRAAEARRDALRARRCVGRSGSAPGRSTSR